MIAQVQLFNRAVVLIDDPKMKSSSLCAEGFESDPWQAFLVPSVPKRALIDPGAVSFAT